MSVGPPSVLLSFCQLHQFVVKFFGSNNFFSHHFRILIANLSVFVHFFPTKLTTLHSTSPGDQFEHIKPFWQTVVCFIYHLRTLSKKIKAFFQKQSAGVSKLLTTCPRWFFEEVFCWKISFFNSSLGFERVFLSFVLTFVGRAVSTAFSLSIAPVCGEILFVKKFFLPSFSVIDRNFIGLCSIFFNQVDDTVFYESERSIWRQTIVLTNFFNLFSSVSNIER